MNRIVRMTLAVSLLITLSGCQEAKTKRVGDRLRPAQAVNGSQPAHDTPRFPKGEGDAIEPAQPKPKRVLTPSPSPDGKDHAMSTVDTDKLFYYLYLMGDVLDCYFTAERMANSVTHSSPLDVAVIQLDEVESIEDLVNKLNNDVEGLTATRSSRWPKVIHLVDDALGGIPDYAIEQVVTMEFSGTVDKLVIRLGEEFNGRIGRVKRGGIPPSEWDLMYDNETQATIDVENETVRNVLTSAVPLENYSRVLWGATTYPTEDHVELGFGGPPWEEEE